MADAHKNFAYSTVLTAPSPASSGTSVVVQSGDGTKFPAASFNAVIWPAGAQPTTANAEIVRVTVVATDTFTITRAQESTSARTVVVGDQIAASFTAKTLTDIENLLPTGTIVGTTDTQTLANKILSDAFYGNAFNSQNALAENLTLPASTNLTYDNLLEVGASNTLEVPATSTLEVEPYVDVATLNSTVRLAPTFLVQSRTAQNVTLPNDTNFLVADTLEVGAGNTLEVPPTSTLEIGGYLNSGSTVPASMITPAAIFNDPNTLRFPFGSGTASISGSGFINYGLGGYIDQTWFKRAGKTTKYRLFCVIARSGTSDTIQVQMYNENTAANVPNTTLLDTTGGTSGTTVLYGALTNPVIAMISAERDMVTDFATAQTVILQLANQTSVSNTQRVNHALLVVYWV